MTLSCRALIVAVALLAPGLAAAQGAYFTTESVLKAFFPGSDRVTYRTLEVAPHRAELEKALGYVPRKPKYTVFLALTGERVDGYALIDEEIGQHLPITLATKLSPEGVVARTEVMVYREPHGDGVRAERFRKQFVGKDAGSELSVGDDVIAISGATISSESMARAVKRAVALIACLRRQPPPRS